MKRIPVMVQQRHVHLSEEDRKALFGDRPLTPMQDLEHRGQLVYQEVVTIVGPNGTLEHVRILGPGRTDTQVELSATDAFALGINAPVRLSGDVLRSGSCVLQGPEGEVRATHAVIIPARHLHMNTAEASAANLTHGTLVAVAPVSRPDEVIEHVSVRVHPTFSLGFHLTTDEAARWWLTNLDRVMLV